jgi:parallel beta-helix repeat protein
MPSGRFVVQKQMLRSCALLSILFVANGMVAAAEIGPNDDIRAAIAALRPGDVLDLRGGTYVLNSSFNISPIGTAASPITVRSKPGETAHIRQDNSNQNIIEVSNAQYFMLVGLEFSGGSHGIRLMNSSDITVQDCEIHDTGDVALSANSGGTYQRLRILHNHIHDTNGTGEGMYLGCNNDDCRVANSLIDGNYVHHTNGPTVEQGDGIELKEGSSGNVISNNVVHDTHYPGILTYSTMGNGPPNVIEGNFIFRTADYAIQSAADSTIRNNIVLGTIGLQAHQAGSPSNQRVVHNTIISAGSAIEVRNVTGAVLIANNALYSQSGSALQLISGNLGLVTVAGNVSDRGAQIGTDFVNGHYGSGPPIDLFPKSGSALIGAGVATYVEQLDFNGTSRSGVADAGAYRFAASGNPGWALAASFKSSQAAKGPLPPTNLQVH